MRNPNLQFSIKTYKRIKLNSDFVGIRVNRGKEFILERDHKFIRNFKDNYKQSPSCSPLTQPSCSLKSKHPALATISRALSVGMPNSWPAEPQLPLSGPTPATLPACCDMM